MVLTWKPRVWGYSLWGQTDAGTRVPPFYAWAALIARTGPEPSPGFAGRLGLVRGLSPRGIARCCLSQDPQLALV